MIYFFDGTKDAFLTAFVLAYLDKGAFLTSGHAQLSLGQETTFVTADGRAKKAEQRLLSFDKGCMRELDRLLRSGDNGHEQTAFLYFKLIAKYKRPVRDMLSEGPVFNAQTIISRVAREIEHMRGFVRFMQADSGVLYAPVSPDHDIVDLLVPHFCARMPEYPFVIHDIKRAKAAVYDGKNRFVAPLKSAEILLSAKEQDWQSLWKTYYSAVNIPSREHLKQMRAYLPVRYRKFMTEFTPNPKK